jgi:hypothetical protein
MHPFIVSYGFEDYERLTEKIGVPPELISRAPDELAARVTHALDMAATARSGLSFGMPLPAGHVPGPAEDRVSRRER